MDFKSLIISFVVLMFVVCGVIIFILRRTFITSTEGALKRLDEEIEKANQKQIELSRKLKQADEELAQRQAEAKEISIKMQTEAEQAGKEEREKIVSTARAQGEEIIEKAKIAQEKLRLELEQEMDIKGLAFGMKLLNQVLSQKARGALDDVLINEFIENLKETDMTNIGPDVREAEIITLNPLEPTKKGQIAQIIKEKLNRDITIKDSTGGELGGGVVIKFGNLSLDGSIKNLIHESALVMKTEIEDRKI